MDPIEEEPLSKTIPSIERIGFISVLKLIALIIAVISPMLVAHILILKGIFTEMIDTKLQQFAVTKIEYEVRRVEMDRAIQRLEGRDEAFADKDKAIEERLRVIESQIQSLREGDAQIRSKIGLRNGG